MADVFISYASPDRMRAEKLSAFLESKGYEVWFDKSLEPAEHYRDTIMSQIDAARVVVCIWTPSSIASVWCRAEANRARVLGKLVPVRTSDLNHDQIPLPFGELHTISLSDEGQIERAIVRQVLSPRPIAPWYRWIWGGTKHEALSWFSVIGVILTLTRGLQELMQFTGLLDRLTGNFLTLSKQFWSAVFFFLPNVTGRDAILLNLALFFFIMFITSCSKSYVRPPLLSEKYLRDHLFGSVAALIIINIFALATGQLSDQDRQSYLFDPLVLFVATTLFGVASTVLLTVARSLVLIVLIAIPVGATLGLGFGFDPAKSAIRLWRVVGGIALLGLLNLASQLVRYLWGS